MSTFAQLVYILCLLTSATCAGLLLRAYLRTATPILLWSAACFGFLALNNLLAVVDLVILPAAVDLALARTLTALAAVSVLLVGFIWEAD